MLPDSAAVEPLLAERDALRGWLARLDETGTATPQAIRAKVRADYEARLDGVIDRLRTHADTLAARLADDQAEYDEQLRHLEAAETALAEAELRHAVGEYDAATFEKEQARHGDEIMRCRLGRDAASERIERIEAVYALVMQPVVPVESLAPASQAAPATPVPVDVAPTPVPEERFDDAVLSVFDEPRGADRTDFSPLSFRPGVGMPAEPARPAPLRSAPVIPADAPPLGQPQESLPRFSRPPETIPATLTPRPADLVPPPAAPAPVAPVSAAPSTGDEFFAGNTIVATGPTPDVATPASRTQRCGECGAMNKALEWYCEKCGAELTAG